MDGTERLRAAKAEEIDLIKQGIMHLKPFQDVKKTIIGEKWDEFEDKIFSLVRQRQTPMRGYPVIYFRAFAHQSGRVVALEFKNADDKTPIVLRFSTELSRCGLLDDAERLPESYQKIILECFEYWTNYQREVAEIEMAGSAMWEEHKSKEREGE